MQATVQKVLVLPIKSDKRQSIAKRFCRYMKEQFCYVFGYVVYSADYKKAHYSMTRKEASAWMACYKGSMMFYSGMLIAQNKVEA